MKYLLFKTPTVALFSLLLFTGTANAGDDSGLNVTLGMSDVSAQASGFFDAVSISVHCNTGDSVSDTEEGMSASVQLVREDGTPFTNGQCHYRATSHPPVDNEALQAALDADDEVLQDQLERKQQEKTSNVSGMFEIVNGRITGFEEDAEGDS